ncbi:lipid asymmetry maintenance protein MlaB [Halomonas sp. HNIBRBA4712]|uniref:STAS domain-containing protein n=1 Tax=Halomonas sp. HNIBRBA4712 TaxID=3373087 RepID=UPI0037461EDC
MSRLLTLEGVTLDQREQTLFLEGDLTMHAAARVAAAGVDWLEREAPSQAAFDFTGIKSATSVALSVLLEWLRTCRARAIIVSRIELSEPLTRLATLAELDELIAHPGQTHAG